MEAETVLQCPDCGLAVCSEECQQGGGYHHLECPLLHGHTADLQAAGSSSWEIISLIRLLETGLQSDALLSLEDHLEELRSESDWPRYSQEVVSFLSSHFPHRWSRLEVEKAAGVLRTNAYCVEAGEPSQYGMVRIIYPLLSLMSVSDVQ